MCYPRASSSKYSEFTEFTECADAASSSIRAKVYSILKFYGAILIECQTTESAGYARRAGSTRVVFIPGNWTRNTKTWIFQGGGRGVKEGTRRMREISKFMQIARAPLHFACICVFRVARDTLDALLNAMRDASAKRTEIGRGCLSSRAIFPAISIKRDFWITNRWRSRLEQLEANSFTTGFSSQFVVRSDAISRFYQGSFIAVLDRARSQWSRITKFAQLDIDNIFWLSNFRMLLSRTEIHRMIPQGLTVKAHLAFVRAVGFIESRCRVSI